MSDIAPVLQSFELAAERAGDIVPAVYASYFARCPGSQELMNLVDTHMRGRMLESVLQLLMSDTVAEQLSYLRFETENHRTYGVQPHMYENLLVAVRDTVRQSLGADWSAEMERAWSARIAHLLREIGGMVEA